MSTENTTIFETLPNNPLSPEVILTENNEGNLYQLAGYELVMDTESEIIKSFKEFYERSFHEEEVESKSGEAYTTVEATERIGTIPPNINVFHLSREGHDYIGVELANQRLTLILEPEITHAEFAGSLARTVPITGYKIHQAWLKGTSGYLDLSSLILNRDASVLLSFAKAQGKAGRSMLDGNLYVQLIAKLLGNEWDVENLIYLWLHETSHIDMWQHDQTSQTQEREKERNANSLFLSKVRQINKMYPGFFDLGSAAIWIDNQLTSGYKDINPLPAEYDYIFEPEIYIQQLQKRLNTTADGETRKALRRRITDMQLNIDSYKAEYVRRKQEAEDADLKAYLEQNKKP